MHHNTVDTDDKARLGELVSLSKILQHALYAFKTSSEILQNVFDAKCDSIPDLVCAAIVCTNVPFKGFCKWAKVILILVNKVIMIGMDIVSYGKQYTRN